MLKITMSPAASNLIRALIARAGVPRDRILLTDVQSTDWQSLTLTGERHQLELANAITLPVDQGLQSASFDLELRASILVARLSKSGERFKPIH